MSARTLAELALKIWGVILLLGSILALPAALWMLWVVPSSDPQAGFMRVSQVGYILSVMVEGLGGLVVLVWADRIVALFESDNTPLQVDVTSKELQVLAFAIVGVVVSIDGLQNVVAGVYVLLAKPAEIDTAQYLSGRQGEVIIKGVIQIAAGALLLFARAAIADGWARLRRARVMDADDPDVDDAD